MGTKQVYVSVSRWVLAAMLAVAVAAVPPPALAARTGPVQSATIRAVKGVTLEIEIASGIVERADLRRWIDEDARRVLDALPDDAERRGSLRIAVVGALYEYEVTITARRDGTVVGTPSTWTCDCSNEELLDRLRTELPAVAERLAAEEEQEQAPAPEPVVRPTIGTVVDEPERRRLGPAGAAGVTLMVLGATGVGTGVALITLTNRPSPDAWSTRQVRELLWPGTLVAGTSVGLLAAGITLYALRDRAGQRRRATVSALGPAADGSGRFSLVVNGRF